MTIEGAPYLREEHYAGLRLREPLRQARARASSRRCAHVRMMAAAQPFL